MTTSEKFQLRIECLNDGKPLFERIVDHPWESNAACNAGCTLISARDEVAVVIAKLPIESETKGMLLTNSALVFMLYCGRGEKTDSADFSISSIGLAILTPELELLYRHPEPVLKPDEKHEKLGIEDGRITKVGRRFVLAYTANSAGESKNDARIAVASTVDFVNWIKHGPLQAKFNSFDNKHGIIFERKVGSKFMMLHNPMEGDHALALHWAEAEDVYGEWKSRGLLMKPVANPAATERRVSGCAPPLKTSDGRYLLLYHSWNRKKDGSDEYNIGIALGDPGNKAFVVKRFEPLPLRETLGETLGSDIAFIGGAYFWNSDLYFPYTDAQSVMHGARLPKSEIDRFIAR